MLKILIVDDHALFREGLAHVLHGLGEETIILEAGNVDRAVQDAAAHPELDLVLLDLNMPGQDGFTALDIFTRQYPALPIVILSASTHRSDIQRCLDAGALGYIPKDTTSTVMINAIRLVLSGGIYTPPSLVQVEDETADSAETNGNGLTPRQMQVLHLLVQGCSNKEIAAEMALAEATIKMHISSILKSLGVSNRTQAAMAAEKLGLVTTRN
ncbi:MAG: response regulator [Gammaproteobacteria bacterium]|nr:response regulator [Gammaproteobacteria bacterium]